VNHQAQTPLKQRRPWLMSVRVTDWTMAPLVDQELEKKVGLSLFYRIELALVWLTIKDTPKISIKDITSKEMKIKNDFKVLRNFQL
jgi:hypothetical protein